MYLSKPSEHVLPVKGDLTLAYLLSIVIAFVMTVASIAGLLFGTGIYPGIEAKLLPLFVGQDALNLVIGLPMLLGSMWLARPWQAYRSAAMAGCPFLYRVRLRILCPRCALQRVLPALHRSHDAKYLHDGRDRRQYRWQCRA